MGLAKLLDELIRAYREGGHDCASSLLPPAPKTALDRMQKRLGVAVPAELMELYHLHGGQRIFGAGVSGLFGGYRLLAPSNVFGEHRSICSNLEDEPPPFPPSPRGTCYFHPRLLPFASYLGHRLCIDSESGQVWDFHQVDGVRGSSRRASIWAVICEVLDLLESGEEPQLPICPPASRRRPGVAERP